jgi:hypothetical protein
MSRPFFRNKFALRKFPQMNRKLKSNLIGLNKTLKTNYQGQSRGKLFSAEKRKNLQVFEKQKFSAHS